MKTKFTLVLLFIFTTFLATKAQQIPNGNFDSWTAGVPTGWSDIDQYLAGLSVNDSLVSEDINSANVAAGCYASAKIETKVIEQAGGLNLTGLLSAGPFSINSGTGAINFSGIPYAYRPDSLSFQYKYQVVSPDTAQYGFSLTQWNGTSETLVGGIPVGYVNFLTTTSGSGFNTVTVSPDYASGVTPDSLVMFFISGGNNSVAGNTLWIDTIHMIFNGSPSDVKNLNVQTIVSMYPVPANAVLHVTVSEAMLNNAYAIYDMNGQVITRGIIESLTSTHEVSQLPSGTYIYSILDANNNPINTAKFIVAK